MPFGVEKWDAIMSKKISSLTMTSQHVLESIETRFEEEAQPLVDLRICFDIDGFWIAWLSCRRVVEMKTRESNLSPAFCVLDFICYHIIKSSHKLSVSRHTMS